MGNTCQTDQHLKPSLYIEEKDANSAHSQDENSLLQSPIHKSHKMKPLMGQHHHIDPERLLNMQRKRHYKKFSYLRADDGTVSMPISLKKALKNINYVSQIHIIPSSRFDNSKRRIKAFVGPLKRLHRVSSLKLSNCEITERSVDDFYQIFKNFNSLQKLCLNIHIDRRANNEKNFLPISQTLKKYQGLRHFSIKLQNPNFMTENLFGSLFLTLRRKMNLETLSIDISSCSERAGTILVNTMKKLKHHPKLTTISLKLNQTLTRQNVFENFANVAPSLQHLYLYLIWNGLGDKQAYMDEMLALSVSLKKLKNFAKLFVKIQAQDLLLALKNTQPIINGLPLKYRTEVFSFLDREINRQSFLDFYPQLISSNETPEIQMCLNREKIYSMKGFCFESPQKSPPGLSIAYICPASTREATEYNKEFYSFLNQVNSSSALTLDFVHNFKVDPSVLKKIFGCLEKFGSLKSLGLDFSGCKIIDQDWIQRFFKLLVVLPQSLSSLNLKFNRCVRMTPQDIQFFITCLVKLKLLKNLTFLGLDFDYVTQITNKNLSALGKELKDFNNLTNLNLFFKGCPQLTDQGVKDLLKNLKATSDLKELQLNFEGCRNITKLMKLNHSMEDFRKNV